MKIRDNYSVFDESTLMTFTGLDYSVYNTVQRNLEVLADMRVADLARLAGVSNATIVRFCKKCGYSGFPEFKQSILTKMREESAKSHPLPSMVENIRATLSSDEFKSFNESIHEAFEALRWTDGVFILGCGRSSGIATYGAYVLSGLGIPAIPITTFPTYAAAIKQGEMGVIVVSQSGTSPSVHTALHELVVAGSVTVAITGDPASPIARLADISVSLHSKDAAAEAAGLVSFFPALYALEELARLLYNDSLAAND